MAGMQRFVTYIYAYENGEKTINTGYAKIETRGSNGWMEIHFSANELIEDEMQIAFLYIKDETIQTMPIGVFRLENGRGMGQYTFRTEMMLGTKYSFDKMVGIKIVGKNEQRYMSFWKDIDVTMLTQANTEKILNEEERKEAVRLEEETEMEAESLHTMEIPEKNSFPIDTIEEVWNNFQKRKPCVQINEDVCAIQMELSDLREFPKCYWYLGNNSFLLHGFFNYRHLLFGRLRSGEWFIGVPGVYERQERVMASIFGFSGFIQIAEPKKTNEMPFDSTSLREMQQGIWYHIVES